MKTLPLPRSVEVSKIMWYVAHVRVMNSVDLLKKKIVNSVNRNSKFIRILVKMKIQPGNLGSFELGALQPETRIWESEGVGV